jgi:UPF0716 protein FxsA
MVNDHDPDANISERLSTMSASKLLLLVLVGMPVAELTAFVAVAAVIGLLPAFALLVGTSLIGGLVLRFAGGTHIDRYRATLGENRIASLQADASGSLILIAGILLLLPGFITDLLGLILLLPPLRHWLGGFILRRIERFAQTSPGNTVVDLKPGEWRQVPEERIPDQRAAD